MQVDRRRAFEIENTLIDIDERIDVLDHRGREGGRSDRKPVEIENDDQVLARDADNTGRDVRVRAGLEAVGHQGDLAHFAYAFAAYHDTRVYDLVRGAGVQR